MLVDSPIRNIGDNVTADAQIDWLDLTWADCGTRALRKQTRAGRSVRLLLKLGVVLQHGDVLIDDETSEVVVNVLPSEVLVTTPKNTTQFIALAYRLGDLHLPVETSLTQIRTPDDGPARGVLEELNIPFESQVIRFHPTLTPAIQLTLASDFDLIKTR